ncbi:MAG: Flp pilus assembly complex ATPase component TadA [Bacilli bacterium]|nr:Flp pilus assembly complex ATPase component TadA [Bacilli bacterium]
MVTFDYKKTPITQIADYIIMYAAKSGASDIHFDPKEDGLMVRIRIDGDLQNYTLIPSEYERNLITRLKLLANMNITESRLPQDGAIKRQFGKLFLDMRTSSLPTNEGEKIVIRILDYSRSLQGLEHLGFSHTNFLKLKRMIEVPNGIILVTGATGTGKSTTTYSILQALNTPKTNIITVEDPIEMNIEGLNQVQVNSEIGLDFATVLRSILRQDPNIILIGEIRDSETAKIAVRASITGHLVLSTIHTNNSLSTIERLLDMDVERYLLSSALTGIISQRLAKMLCPKCRIEREAIPYEKKLFQNILHKEIEVLYDANHDGCENCHNGYKGRIAIQEVLEIDDDIRNALNNEKLEREDLRKMVYTSNVITLLQDGLEKVLEGVTSFEEIYRIIEIDSDSTEDYGAELIEANKERINQQKQEELKEQTNTEVKKSDALISQSKKEEENISNSLGADQATANTVESIMNKEKKEEQNKSDIIITPPSVPVFPEPKIPDHFPTNNDINNTLTTNIYSDIDNNPYMQTTNNINQEFNQSISNTNVSSLNNESSNQQKELMSQNEPNLEAVPSTINQELTNPETEHIENPLEKQPNYEIQFSDPSSTVSPPTIENTLVEQTAAMIPTPHDSTEISQPEQISTTPLIPSLNTSPKLPEPNTGFNTQTMETSPLPSGQSI